MGVLCYDFFKEVLKTRAEKLFAEAELQAAQKYAQLQKMVELYAIDEEEK